MKFLFFWKMELLVKRATLMFAAFVLLLRGGVVAIPLADFYQFCSEAGDMLMNRNDDGFSPPITLPPYILLEEEYNIICVSIATMQKTYLILSLKCLYNCYNYLKTVIKFAKLLCLYVQIQEVIQVCFIIVSSHLVENKCQVSTMNLC